MSLYNPQLEAGGKTGDDDDSSIGGGGGEGGVDGYFSLSSNLMKGTVGNSL